MATALPTARANPFDPPIELGILREQEPISRLAYPDGHIGWLVTNDQLARAILTDSRFSSRMELIRTPIRRPRSEGFSLGQPARPGFFGLMDPPDHTRYRRLLASSFTVRKMAQLQPRIAQIVSDHLDRMEQIGPPVDLVQEFALPIPSLVICELLGVPYDDRAEFQRNSAIVLSLDATDEEGTEAMRSFDNFFKDLVSTKRAHPTDDLMSKLVATGELEDDELVGVGMLLLIGGHETTANMFALGILALLRHPDQLQALRDRACPIDLAVEELLRYLSIVQFGMMRCALEDVELDNKVIKQGDTVTISIPAVNRDPERFYNPDTLDLSRRPNHHLAFGHGIHQCIGQQLARVEMKIGYRALLERFPTLSLAASVAEIPLREDMFAYGVHRLPLTW